VKTKKPKKEENNSSAFSHLIEQVEKEKKRAKIMYSVGIVVLSLSLFSFLLFSPFEVPAFSQLGDKILGREEVQEEEPEKEEVVEEPEEEEEPEEIEEPKEEEEEKVVETQRVYVQQQAPPPPPPAPEPEPESEPEPEPEPLYSCPSNTMEYYIDEYCKNLGNANYYDEIARGIREDAWGECEVYSTPDGFMDCLNRASARADEWSADATEYRSEASRFKELLITSCGVSVSEMQEVTSICW